MNSKNHSFSQTLRSCLEARIRYNRYDLCRASTRRRATCGRSPWPYGRSWTLADGSLTSTCRTRKWCRVCDDCIGPIAPPTPTRRAADARRIPITFSPIYRSRPRAPRIFTIWCSTAGGGRRARGQPSGRSRCSCSGRTSATRPHPDIERLARSRSTRFAAVATCARLDVAHTLTTRWSRMPFTRIG